MTPNITDLAVALMVADYRPAATTVTAADLALFRQTYATNTYVRNQYAARAGRLAGVLTAVTGAVYPGPTTTPPTKGIL